VGVCAAFSLGRLRAHQDRRVERRDVLGPVYDRFTKGIAKTDLRDARGLLDSLARA
jgi:hypothetical protein